MRRSLFVLGALAIAARSAIAQPASVSGVVVARETGEPLAYAVVALPALSRELFANDSGAYFFGDLPQGTVTLRVRRLGYLPHDTVVAIAREAAPVRVALTRVATRLERVTVSAHPPCLDPGAPQIAADPRLATIVDQVRLNAEQYKFLVDHYPLIYLVEVIRSSRRKADGEVRTDQHFKNAIDARSRWDYEPGRVIVRVRGQYEFNIPTLVDVADRDFLAQHCFHYGGIEVVDGDTLLRVDVVVAERVKDPDVNGQILIDPRTFQVRRTVLRLSRLTKQTSYLEDFEVTTNFKEVLPSIPVIASVYAVQTMATSDKLDFDVAYEEQFLVSHTFTKRTPGAESRKRP